MYSLDEVRAVDPEIAQAIETVRGVGYRFQYEEAQ